jgi:hypothetical protein
MVIHTLGWRTYGETYLFYATALSFTESPLERLASVDAQNDFYQRLLQPNLVEPGSTIIRGCALSKRSLNLIIVACLSLRSSNHLSVTIRKHSKATVHDIFAPNLLALQRIKLPPTSRGGTSTFAHTMISDCRTVYVFSQEVSYAPNDDTPLHTSIIEDIPNSSENGALTPIASPTLFISLDWQIVERPAEPRGAATTDSVLVIQPPVRTSSKPSSKPSTSTSGPFLEEITFSDDSWAKSLVNFSTMLGTYN